MRSRRCRRRQSRTRARPAREPASRRLDEPAQKPARDATRSHVEKRSTGVRSSRSFHVYAPPRSLVVPCTCHGRGGPMTAQVTAEPSDAPAVVEDPDERRHERGHRLAHGLRWTFWRHLCFGGLAGALVFFCLSLTPSLLPRGWGVQGLLSGITTVIGYG